MSKIEKLTEEQLAQIPVVRDMWLKIGLSTEPADRPRAEAAVKWIYEQKGWAAPKIIWVKSPLVGCYVSWIFSRSMDQVRDQVWGQVRDQVWGQVRDQVWGQVGDQVEDQVWGQVGDQVGDQVRGQVGDQVGDQVRGQVRDQVYRSGYGLHDASWLAFYYFFRDAIPETQKLAGLWELAQAAGWWWPFDKLCIISERPCSLSRDERNRLHCETGPALAYPDGFGVYAWHGVRVAKEIIEHPETITAEKITVESNQEIKRVMIERYTWDRYLSDIGAKEIHSDKYGTLLEAQINDRTSRFVRVACPSTGRQYALPVAPTTATAHEAVASTFGMSADEYAPTVET